MQIDDLSSTAAHNTPNPKANPSAQTRSWSFGPGGFAEDDHDNPIVEGRLRRTDCAQVTDGVAGVLLVSDRFRASQRGTNNKARIAGWGHGTAGDRKSTRLNSSHANKSYAVICTK